MPDRLDKASLELAAAIADIRHGRLDEAVERIAEVLLRFTGWTLEPRTEEGDA